MTDIATTHLHGHPSTTRPKLDQSFGIGPLLLFGGLLAAGILYTAYSLYSDTSRANVGTTTLLPFLLLGVALLVALAFEFVNGFHDTANAVATVIYTHSLPAHFAVVWSGCWNFLGVLTSTGAVAFGIVSLLPVELILQVGSAAGFAMVYALLIAAIVWNLATWYLGLPASSSHTLIGSIIGVGLANQLMATAGSGTSGVDWSQAANVGKALLLSPIIGFVAAAILLVVLKFLVRKPELYGEPKGNRPPTWWVRGLLVLTCTGVSFAHGSNDGQKGMGLIMLILIGTVPTAYALNHAMPDSQVTTFRAIATVTQQSLATYAAGAPAPADSRTAVEDYVRTRQLAPATIPALAKLTGDIGTAVGTEPKFDAAATKNLAEFRKSLDGATKFIPLWVKVAVAIALGLGTMIGWKRIVVTVGEKIGKTHMTYAQGGAAELVAMTTIAAADMYGLPVSTTHVLSSGVAGTMVANGSGLQMSTVRNLLMAWVLTLPAAILLSGCLYYLFRHIF